MSTPQSVTIDAADLATPRRYVSSKVIQTMLMISSATFQKYRKDDPTFPKPHILRGSIHRWDLEKIEEWIAAQPVAKT